jgi:hypothetical protein
MRAFTIVTTAIAIATDPLGEFSAALFASTQSRKDFDLSVMGGSLRTRFTALSSRSSTVAGKPTDASSSNSAEG